MTRGTRPPTRKTACHPKRDSSAALTKPPSAAPTVKPHDTSIIQVTRVRAGLNSPASAIALGMMQPSPRPVTKRRISRALTVSTCVVASMHAAKKNVATISTGRRPKRSPSTPNTSEPTSMPNNPAPNTGPRLALVIFQSLMMAGAT